MRARALWVLLGLYLAARLVVVFRSTVFTSYDSFSYAYRTDPSLNRGPLVSFFGDAPRLWGVPLFYAVLPSDAPARTGSGRWARWPGARWPWWSGRCCGIRSRDCSPAAACWCSG